MKLLKTCLSLFIISLLLASCKEVIDKRKDEPQKKQIDATAFNSFAKNVNAQDFKTLIDANTGLILDVRTSQEYYKGHIPGAINVDWKNQTEFTTKIKALAKDKTVLVYCHSGHRSGLATRFLKEQGYEKIYNLESGIVGWKADNFDIEK
jgi:rhodanese-related sulfurtransferase